MTRRNRSQKSLQRIRQAAKRAAFLVGGIFAIVLAFSFFFDEMGVRKYLSMSQRARELQEEITELERVNADLRVEMRRIQSDPFRIEELARERLGFVRKGETVYQIVPDASDGTKLPGRP